LSKNFLTFCLNFLTMLRTTFLVCRTRVPQTARLSSAVKPVVGGEGYQISQHDRDAYYPKIGDRDIVGSGWNNRPQYADRRQFPYPAVRYGENNATLAILREKEKGDWKNLSLEEKKQLYRAGFRQTFAEFTAPTGEWKFVATCVLTVFSFTLWVAYWIKEYVTPPLPYSFTDEYRYKMVKKFIDMNNTPVRGFTSEWDYDRMKWKWEKD